MESHKMDNNEYSEMKSCHYDYDKLIRNSFQTNMSNDPISKHHQIHGSKHDQFHGSKQNLLHAKALEVAATYKKSEIDLIEVLQQVWQEKTFYYFNCNSLFEYAVQKLHLSREVANIYNKIAKKALIIPGLKEQIKTGNISVSNANRICSVITLDNKEKWFTLAAKAFAYSSHPTALSWRNQSSQQFNHFMFWAPSGPSLRALSLILYFSLTFLSKNPGLE